MRKRRAVTPKTSIRKETVKTLTGINKVKKKINTINEWRENFIDPTKFKRIREYYKLKYADKFNNLDEIDHFYSI